MVKESETLRKRSRKVEGVHRTTQQKFKEASPSKSELSPSKLSQPKKSRPKRDSYEEYPVGELYVSMKSSRPYEEYPSEELYLSMKDSKKIESARLLDESGDATNDIESMRMYLQEERYTKQKNAHYFLIPSHGRQFASWNGASKVATVILFVSSFSGIIPGGLYYVPHVTLTPLYLLDFCFVPSEHKTNIMESLDVSKVDTCKWTDSSECLKKIEFRTSLFSLIFNLIGAAILYSRNFSFYKTKKFVIKYKSVKPPVKFRLPRKGEMFLQNVTWCLSGLIGVYMVMGNFYSVFENLSNKSPQTNNSSITTSKYTLVYYTPSEETIFPLSMMFVLNFLFVLCLCMCWCRKSDAWFDVFSPYEDSDESSSEDERTVLIRRLRELIKFSKYQDI